MGTEAITAKNITKIFGSVRALDKVSLTINKGSFHALVGENGAGKSTIAKCFMGINKPDEGQLLFKNKLVNINNPKEAHELGIGMVFQHFMLIENMTVAENLLLARKEIPFTINWEKEKSDLEAFMNTIPFQLDLNSLVANLSAGEKQKLEITKMLYLNCKILILDEPTSVLTPGEADEVLSYLRKKVDLNELTVIIITHKFREVFGYADAVSVLRRGIYVGGGKVADFTKTSLAELMIGSKVLENKFNRIIPEEPVIKLQLVNLYDEDDNMLPIINNLNISINKGEIYGMAGVSGNGQKRLVEILGGQKKSQSGNIIIDGHVYQPGRKQKRMKALNCLPEEPLKNACVPAMSVAENMALYHYDIFPFTKKGLVKKNRINDHARKLINSFNVKTPHPNEPIKNLSGGNVQRAVLARELAGDLEVLIISNPCFGLDFNAIAFIRSLIIEARNNGTCVLLLSEDLDEIIELSDKIGVIFNGQIIYETTANQLDMQLLGEKMAGH